MTLRMLIVVAAVVLVAIPSGAQVAGQPSPSTQVPDAAQFVGAPKGVRLEGGELRRRTDEVAALLRCPVCQGMAVADSPAEMAVNMKRQVSELLARGYTEEQILSYFEQSYGQFVLLKPKFEGLIALVWILPVLALVIGGVIVFMKWRKLERGAEPTSVTHASASGTSAEVVDDPYLAQVRDLVGGGK